jgi:hypothetical protein
VLFALAQIGALAIHWTSNGEVLRSHRHWGICVPSQWFSSP